SMLVTSQPCDLAPQVVLNTPRAAVRPNPGNTIAVDHDWYEEHIVAQGDGQYRIDTSVIKQVMAGAGNRIGDGAPVTANSRQRALKPIPGHGEPGVGESQRVPGCFVVFTHSGATLALILGGMRTQEMLTGVKHPMLATFRPER